MKRKLFIIFFCLVLLPTLALSYSNYRKTEESANVNVNQAMLQTLIQIEYNIENTLSNITRISDTLFYDSELRDFLGEENTYDLLLQVKQLKILRNLFYNFERDRGLYKVRIYVDGKKMASTEHVNFFPLESAQKQAWYEKTVEQKGANVWSGAYLETGIAAEPDYWLISCARVLKHSDNFFANDGILSLDIRESTLYSYLQDIHLRDGEEVFITDGSGNLISGQEKSRLGKAFLDENILRKISGRKKGIIEPEEIKSDDYVVFTTVEGTGWKIVDRIGRKNVLENYSFWSDSQFVVLSIAVLLLFVAASFVIINNLTRELMNRMRRIGENIEKEGIRTGRREFVADKKDDLGKIEELVYEMLDRSKALAEETYEARLKERKAQLMALQAQINPHFLYNTLECLNWMAIRQNAPDISSLITKLAKYFRLTLNKGKSIVGIEDELELARIYLTIQNTRFDDVIGFEINMDPDITKYHIPKLTLQPIMENAVLHGIMKKPEKSGYIIVDARVLEEEIVISIKDDGTGMTKMRAEELLSRKQSEHYGLFNVQERIKLYFGENYGITIDSEPGAGTKVTLRIGKTVLEE